MGGVGGIKSNYLNFSWLDLICQAFKTKFFAKYKPQRVVLKLELAKYYKDSEMTAFISERSRNSK